MSGLARLPQLLEGARQSRFRLWLLNQLLDRVIPFNRPHGVKILEVSADRVRTTADARRRNHNHLRGVHACCIATVAEFSSGLMLISRLDPSRYRLIMARLEVDYLYQAKGVIVAESVLTETEFAAEVLRPLQEQDLLIRAFETLVHDQHGNLVAKAYLTWQVKSWNKVRTQPT